MRLLFVEDEKFIAEALEQVLKKNNYTVDLAFDGEYGLDCALSGIYDIIVLDIMLPRIDGLTVLKRIRGEGIRTPVILLTARGSVEDRVKGLDSGADDYLAKPFHSEELLARLRALSRRQADMNPDGLLRFGGLSLNPGSLVVSYSESDKITDGAVDEVKLSLKEAQILELLIKNSSILLSKDTIIEKVWGYDSEAEDSHVETHMSLLRKKLSGLTSDVTIRTMRGAGYILVEASKK